jgi:hypothetical protein
VQATDHCNRQSTLSVEDLGDPGARADYPFQVSSREPLLLHTKFDRLDRIGRIHGMVFCLICDHSAVEGDRSKDGEEDQKGIRS